MNRKSLGVLFALALVALASAAVAAAAKTVTAKPQAREVVVTATADHDGPVLADDEGEDGDDMDLEDAGDAAGAEGSQRVMIRRPFQGGPGGMGRWGMGPGGRGMGPGMRRRGPGGPPNLERLAQRLGLSDAQRARLEDIRDRQQRRDIQARADLAIARLDLRKAMKADKPELSAINSQIDKLARMRADLAKSRVASHLEARAVLTPEQQKQMKELRERGPRMGMDEGGEDGPARMGRGGRRFGGMGPGNTNVRVRIERDSTGGDWK
jgi:Spy/CpxP family protein refolding chaperone